MAKNTKRPAKSRNKVAPPSQKPRGDGKRGVRSTEAVHHQRLRVLEDMMASCVPWHAILEDLTERFDVGGPTVYAWAQEIRDRWTREEETLRPQRKAVYRARLEALYYRAYCQNELLVAVQVAKLQASLDGFNAPTKVQVTGTLSVAALTPDQRRKEIDALLARRELARRRRPVLDAKATEH